MRKKWAIGLGVGVMLTVAFLRMATMWREWMAEEMIPLMRALIYAGGAALTVWVAAALTLARRRKWRPERVFLILFIPLSLAMMAVTPVERALDEKDHLRKIWQISAGDLMPTRKNGGVFSEPANLFEGMEEPRGVTLLTLYEQLGTRLDMENTVAVEAAANTGFYPVHNYFPQALGMALARLVTDNRLVLFYSARLGAWLVSLLMLYYAIRKAPVGKNAIMLASMTPMALQELASASADGMTIAFVAAFLAFVLDLCRRRERMRGGEYAAMFGLAFCASTFKLMYFPLTLLLAAVPAVCFGGRREKWRTVVGVFSGIAALIAGWALLCKLNYATGEAAQAGNILPQIQLILSRPVRYAMTCMRTLMTQADEHLMQIVGGWLSWYDIPIPPGIYIGYMAAFGAAMARGRGLRTDEGGLRAPLLALSGVCVAIIFTALYAWYTPYGAPEILGIQGRYFLPLVLPIALALKRADDSPLPETCSYGCMAAASFLDIGALAIVLAYTIC